MPVDAKDWLTAALADGPLPVQQVMCLAKIAGMNWNSVLEARQSMAIHASMFGLSIVWELEHAS